MKEQPSNPLPVGLEDADDFEASFIEPLTPREQAAAPQAALDDVALDDDFPSSTIIRPPADTDAEVAAATEASGTTPADAHADAERSEASGITADSAPAWVGKKMGQFKLLRLIGEGSMGRVILAKDTHLNRNVALKILRRRIRGFSEQQRVRQFLCEAQAAARIQHPNVVQIYEIDQFRGWWYIAMELVEGETLKQIIKASGRLTPAQICPVIADAASALAVAHANGVIHRDVKPGNLLITRTGRCKLTDFGLVRIDDPYDPFHTSKQAVGTPVFMAPEVIAGHANTPAVDVYSLGVTLYYALAGHPPFESKDIRDLIKHHEQSNVPDVRDKAPTCSKTLAALLKRAMGKQPEDRPSAVDFAAALRAEVIATRGEESLASFSSLVGESSIIGLGSARYRPITRTEKRQRFFRAAVAMLAVLGIAAGSYWIGRYFNMPEPQIPVLYPEVDQFAKEFPEAPSTYGDYLRPERFAPLNVEPPPFSWRHKIEQGDYKFVASQSGRHFYPVDANAAALIRHDLFVGYQTAEDAIADGKTPRNNHF